MSKTPSERRTEPRHKTSTVTVELLGVRCTAENINISGMKVKYPSSLEIKLDDVADVVIIEQDFCLPLTGKVVWINDQEGSLGLHFQWKSERVANLVEKILKDSDLMT